MSAPQTAQQEFDEIYVTSGEICKVLGIDRSTLCMGRKRGLLPDPVKVNGDQILLWKRTSVQENLDAWKIMLQARRGKLNT
jgi:hypothetical protein